MLRTPCSMTRSPEGGGGGLCLGSLVGGRCGLKQCLAHGPPLADRLFPCWRRFGGWRGRGAGGGQALHITPAPDAPSPRMRRQLMWQPNRVQDDPNPPPKTSGNNPSAPQGPPRGGGGCNRSEKWPIKPHYNAFQATTGIPHPRNNQKRFFLDMMASFWKPPSARARVRACACMCQGIQFESSTECSTTLDASITANHQSIVHRPCRQAAPRGCK